MTDRNPAVTEGNPAAPERRVLRSAVIRRPGEVLLEEKRLPAPGPDEVLVRVRAAAICGSDLHLYRGKHPDVPLPSAVGHELAGEVEAVGEGVTRVRPGARVTVEPVLACGGCEFCLKGHYNRCLSIAFGYRKGYAGLANYYLARERWVHRLPPGMPFTEAALLEPLAVAVHAVRAGGVGLGDRVAVFGAGPIGLLVAGVCLAIGAEAVWMVDVRDDRLSLAAALGVTGAVNARQGDPVAAISEATGGRGVTASFEAAGLEITLVQSLNVLAKGGRATLVGIFERPEVTLFAPVFIRNEISLRGVSGYCDDFGPAISLAASGRVRLAPLVTHRFPLSAVADAFVAADRPDAGACKVIVEPEEE